MPGGNSLEPELWLVGTVVASHPNWSRASLSTGSGRGSTRVYRIGEELPDQSTLVAIRSDRVVLDRDGERQVLMLQERKSAPRAPAEPPEQKTAPASGLIKSTGPDRYQVNRRELLDLVEKSADLLDDTRVSLAFAPDGGVSGLRLVIRNTNTAFDQFDLKDGDLIHRIGSLIIDSPEKIEQVPDLLKNVRELDVEMTRDGEMRTLRYFFD